MCKRIFITTSDIERISGKSNATAWRELQTCKDALGKQKHQQLTFKEYAEYIGVNIDELYQALKDAQKP